MNKLPLIFLFLLILPLTSASDFAYIVKSSAGVDSHLVSEFESLGFSLETVYEINIPSTNFSKYRILIIGNQNLDSPEAIPIDQYRSLTLNSYNYYKRTTSDYQLGWSIDNGVKSSPTQLSVVNTISQITAGLPGNFNAYTVSNINAQTSYLEGQKPSGTVNLVSNVNAPGEVVVASLSPGNKFLNNKTLTQKAIFFGITSPQYWTSQSRQLFTNSISWLLEDEDRDNDGYAYDLDCNDLDSESHPGAEEIPYDNKDQDCDGSDLNDLDEDGYSSDIVGGLDCDDFDPIINPSNPDVYNNCINDAPIVQNIPTMTVDENSIASFSVDATDPENDILSYKINDLRFIVSENTFSWQTTYEDSGDNKFNVTVSDGSLDSIKTVLIEVKNLNRPPTLTEIPQILWNEDSSYILNLSNYFKDLDLDFLVFGIEDTSPDTNVFVSSPASGIFNFSSRKDWSGSDWIQFWASDLKDKTVSNIVLLNVSPVNDAPVFTGKVSNFTWNEDTNLTNAINLRNYFSDVDSDITFSVSGNTNIAVAIDNGIVSFIPLKDYNGQETIIFTGSDSEYSVSSNSILLTILDVKETPEFSNLTCKTGLEEDLFYSCILTATDFENDTILFSSSNENNLHCDLENNVLTYYSYLDFNGVASCILTASDADGETPLEFTVNISAVNDAPIFISDIENITWNEDTNLTNALNLSLYFNDPDSSLDYLVSGNTNINILIENGIASLYPTLDYNGQETIIFTGSDSEYSVSSNSIVLSVIDVGETPVLMPLNCQTQISEDETYQCSLEATDFENDTILFSSSNENNLHCDLENNVLTYYSYLDFNGVASCNIIASDKDGSNSLSLEVNISAVNDAPKVKSVSPVTTARLIEGQSKEFSIEFEDPESENVLVSWYLDNEPKASHVNKYLFLGDIQGTHTLTVKGSDSKNESEYSWNIVVGDISEFTCSEALGSICLANQVCPGSILGVSDSNLCCSVSCIPQFRDADYCKTLNNSIGIRITEPLESESFDLGETLRAEIEVENNYNKEQDIEVVAQLYNLDRDEAVGKEFSTETTLSTSRIRTVSVKLDIPADEDLDLEKDNFAIFVKAEDKVCNQNYIPIKLTRPDDLLAITKLDVPNNVYCGDLVKIRATTENLGDSNQDSIYLTLRNGNLKINEQSDKFDLDNYGGRDDKKNFEFEVQIPDNVTPGKYPLDLSVIYGSKRSSISNDLEVLCNDNSNESEENESQAESDEMLKLNSVTSEAKQENSGNREKVLLMLGITFLISMFASVLLVAYIIFFRKKIEVN